MVTRQHCFYMLLLLFMLPVTLHAAPRLILQLDDQHAEPGKALRATLYAIDIKQAITEVDLQPLERNFGVVTGYSVNQQTDARWPGQDVQLLKLKLYPRQTGSLSVPSLALAGIRSNSLNIMVAGNDAMLPQLSLSQQQVWQRQLFYLYISFESRHASARLRFDTPLHIPGFVVVPLNFERIKKETGKYELRTGLALMSTRPGLHKINLPALQYHVSGVLRRQFYLPSSSIDVRSLPAYLPPTLPVATIALHTRLPDQPVLLTEQVYYLDITVSADVIDPRLLPAILRQLKNRADIHYLPAQIKRTRHIQTRNMQAVSSYQVPFKLMRNGYISPGVLAAHYFNPQTGRLERVTIALPGIVALNKFWYVLLVLLTLAILIAIIGYGGKWIKQQMVRYQKRQQAMSALQHASQPEQLRQALHDLASAENWPCNLTPQQWAQRWQARYRSTTNFADSIRQIEHCLYAKQSTYCSQAAQHLLQHVRSRRKHPLFTRLGLKQAVRKSTYWQ